jgi:hypothetical protein
MATHTKQATNTGNIQNSPQTPNRMPDPNKPTPKGNWVKSSSGDKGAYTDYTLRFGVLLAHIEEMNAPYGGYGGGGRTYAPNKHPVSQWSAKIGGFAIPYQSNQWDFPSAEEAMVACEKCLRELAQNIQASLPQSDLPTPKTQTKPSKSPHAPTHMSLQEKLEKAFCDAHKAVAKDQNQRFGNPLTEPEAHKACARILSKWVDEKLITPTQATKLAKALGKAEYGEYGLTFGRVSNILDKVLGSQTPPWHKRGELELALP